MVLVSCEISRFPALPDFSAAVALHQAHSTKHCEQQYREMSAILTQVLLSMAKQVSTSAHLHFTSHAHTILLDLPSTVDVHSPDNAQGGAKCLSLLRQSARSGTTRGTRLAVMEGGEAAVRPGCSSPPN